MDDHTLARDTLKLLETGDFADTEIHCQGKVWKVHKIILSTRSPFFAKALNGDWQESTSGRVNLDEMDQDVLNRVIDYIYSDTLPDSDENLGGDEPFISLQEYAAMWIQADFLQMRGLKDHISSRLIAKFSNVLYDLCTFEITPTYVVKKTECWLTEESKLTLFLDDFNKAARLIYKAQVAAARKPQLAITAFVLALRERMPEEQLRSLLDDLPDFAADIHSAIVQLHFSHGSLGRRYGTGSLWDLINGALANRSFLDKFNCGECGLRMVDNECMTCAPWNLGHWQWCSKHGRQELSKFFLKMVDKLGKKKEPKK